MSYVLKVLVAAYCRVELIVIHNRFYFNAQSVIIIHQVDDYPDNRAFEQFFATVHL